MLIFATSIDGEKINMGTINNLKYGVDDAMFHFKWLHSGISWFKKTVIEFVALIYFLHGLLKQSIA